MVGMKPEIPGIWATPQQIYIFAGLLIHRFGDGSIQTTNNMVIVCNAKVTWFFCLLVNHFIGRVPQQ